MFQRRSTLLATMAALALCVGACGDDPSSPSGDRETVADYVASVSIENTQGELQDSRIPRPTTGGPALLVNGHSTIVNGGTATLSVSSPTPFQTVYVAGSTPISELFVPVSGFYEIALPAPTSSANLLLTFPQTLPSGDFDLYISAVDPTGNVGTLAERPFNALVVGAGDVQVTVAWDTDADVDLHVVDPAGVEIYWANRLSPSGGQLDLDSNAACSTDNVRNENITWSVGTAPQGDYTVRVDYWSACGAVRTEYTVLIHSEGNTEIHRGIFTGSGDNGGLGSGTLITYFARATGPQPAPILNRSILDLPVGPTTK